ncbi:MAG: hypothetical protein P8J87_03375 [Verrucomicrobiales bacterium]|nr:hypothetical protein [Verrucomicrobiales bacterium]
MGFSCGWGQRSGRPCWNPWRSVRARAAWAATAMGPKVCGDPGVGVPSAGSKELASPSAVRARSWPDVLSKPVLQTGFPSEIDTGAIDLGTSFQTAARPLREPTARCWPSGWKARLPVPRGW